VWCHSPPGTEMVKLRHSLNPQREFEVASPYIERILKARVYDVAIESPLEDAPRLSRRLGNRVMLKREDLQPVFSFKLRGAYNRIAHMSDAAAKRGVVCASAGNHAQGVALAVVSPPSLSCRRPPRTSRCRR
jgi:threonine dehydratase